LGELPIPAVVELETGGFSVLYGLDRGAVVLGDPRGGIRAVPFDQFTSAWGRRAPCLAYLPPATFESAGPRAIFRQFLPLVMPYRAAIVSLLGLSLLAQVFGLFAPFLNKVIIDNVLVTFDRGLLRLLLVGILVITAFQLGANSLREYLSAHIMR